MVEGKGDTRDQPLRNDPLLSKVPEVEGYKVLEPCVLYAKVGEGGMGAVYRGRHLNLDIDVAIKCLKNVLAEQSPSFVTRFQREARIAASVHHQNLVQVYDISEKNGVHYLVMEYVRGETARERVVRKGRLKEAEALKILLGAASGLAEAHGKRIVHRDIKPDNILISYDGTVKVSDLGLAKALEVDAGPSLTMGVMGTPQYMAPEQWEDSATVGPQADVWALGATFYYLLTGDHAIPTGSMQQIYRRICVDAFPDVQEKVPSISTHSRSVLERCVQHDPKLRYADCRELVRELSKVVVKDTGGPLSDADSGSIRVPPLLSPPPAETMGHIRVALQDVGTKTLGVNTPASAEKARASSLSPQAGAAVPPSVAPTPGTGTQAPSSPEPRWRRPLLGLVSAAALVVVGWFVFDRMRPSNERPALANDTPATPKEDRQDRPAPNDSVPPKNNPVQEGPLPGAGTISPVDKSTPIDEQPVVIDAPKLEASVAPGVVVEHKPDPVLSLDPPESSYVKVPSYVISGLVEHAVGVIELRSDPEFPLPEPVAAADGRFELHLTLPREGEYSFWVSTQGLPEQKQTIVYDGTAPTLVLPERQHVRSSEYELVVQADDPISGVAGVRISDSELELRNGSWSTSLSLTEGENRLEISARDNAGNEDHELLVIDVDSVAPALTSVTPEPGGELNPGKARKFTLAFTESFSSLEINGQSFFEGEIPRTAEALIDVEQGQPTFQLHWRVTDLLGNSREDSREWTVRTKPTSPFGWEVDESKGGYAWNGAPSGAFIARRHTDSRTGIAFVLVESLNLYVAETEVTVAQFKSWPKSKVKDGLGQDLPVTEVSWKEANEYCKSYGYSLPTREDWMAACIAGGAGPYSDGIDDRNLSQYAWYDWPGKKGQSKAPVTPQPVKGKQPNNFGLYDMHGNVWELCQERTIKLGGSYSTPADLCKADYQCPATGSSGASDTGFRPVKRVED